LPRLLFARSFLLFFALLDALLYHFGRLMCSIRFCECSLCLLALVRQLLQAVRELGDSLRDVMICDFPSIFAQPSYTAMRRAAILGSAAAFQPPPTDTSTDSHSLFNPAPPEAGLAAGDRVTQSLAQLSDGSGLLFFLFTRLLHGEG